jgi:hypothetical protein
VFEEDEFDNEIETEFTVYSKIFIPCIQELRRVVFPDGKRWLREHQQLYSQMKSVLEQALKNLDTLSN